MTVCDDFVLLELFEWSDGSISTLIALSTFSTEKVFVGIPWNASALKEAMLHGLTRTITKGAGT